MVPAEGRLPHVARTFTLVRHGQSTYNVAGLVNGDPSVPVFLTEVGMEQARAAAEALEPFDFDRAIHTRFVRTHQTLAILLDGSDIPTETYPQLDDVHLGIFEGRPVGEYRAWRHSHTPDDKPPGEGESRVDVLYRYLRGFERMIAEDTDCVLAVLHDVPIRFMANAVLGADPLDGPVKDVQNAEIRTFDQVQMEHGLAVFRDRLGY
jgi:probable phosphoglycerate mutase